MDLSHLKTFVAIAELGSITRASRRLHLSQPAVSAQLKRLEDDLELPLFRRTARGMSLTDAGERLLPEAQALLSRTDAFTALASRLAGRTVGTLRVGVIDCGYDLALPRIVATLSREHPELDVRVTSATSGVNLHRVLDHQLDAAFLEGGEADPRLTRVPLGTARVGVLLPADQADAVAEAPLEALDGLPWIGRAPGCSYQVLLDSLRARHHLHLDTRHMATSSAHANALVEEGVGIAFADIDDVAPAVEAGRVALWGGEVFEIPVWCVLRADRADEPVLEAWVDVLRRMHRGELRYSA